MVPLIDVVLVLLVIFIVTAPLMTHAVKLDLPKASSTRRHPETGEDRVLDRRHRRRCSGTASRSAARMRRPKFTEAGQKRPQPEIYLRADQGVAYRFVAETLADASKAGLSKVAFVSEPAKRL